MTFISILDALHLVRGVWLEDYRGYTTPSICYVDPWGKRWCRVYPFAAVGYVILHEDGSTGECTYIDRWKYMRS